MMGPVIDLHLHVHDREAGENALVHGFDHALFHRGNEIPGNGPSNDFVEKFKSAIAWQRVKLKPAIAVLPVAARLFFVFSLGLGHFLNGLAIGDFRCMQVDVHSVFPVEFFQGQLDMSLPDSTQQHFLGLVIADKFQ